MFENAQNFNQDLSAWDVNNVLGFNDFDAETPSWTLPKPNFISPFYLDANGITVKAKEGTPIGAKGLLNGVEYTVVDSYMLSNRIRNGEDVTKVCTSRVEYMDGGMFHEHFNQDLSSWDVSNVTSMQYMFYNAHDFNQDLSAWDVSNVTSMQYMFYNAHDFNQDLSAWDVSNVQGYLGFDSNAYPSMDTPQAKFQNHQCKLHFNCKRRWNENNNNTNLTLNRRDALYNRFQ